MSALRELLQTFRQAAQSEREKGTYFEKLTLDFLKRDAVYAPQFSDVWTFTEWAKLQGKAGNDTGIDLVAKNADGNGFCAIQCKFYAEDYAMQKGDIDSFFTEAGKKEFTRCIVVDSTRMQWSENAENALVGQSKPTTRIGLADLESSPIDWDVYRAKKIIQMKPKRTLRKHQADALAGTKAGFATADRGKLIMACGTGKTFTALKIAEDLAGSGKRVLFLVPSLSLMSQTITEWTIESSIPLHSFAVCSDVQVGTRKNTDDLADTHIHDLALPALTDAKKLADQDKLTAPAAKDKMTVVFSTYHSIKVVSDAQKKHGFPDFDLIICDEAHRTTGAALVGDESAFMQIHDASFIKGTKRLYMTATPRIYGDLIKTKAKDESVELASMDDPLKYGETLYELSFSKAVRLKLLCRYKVIVLAVSETAVSATLQARQADGNEAGLKLDDVTKMIGCYRGLSLVDAQQKAEDVAAGKTIRPMRRAVAFCNTIANSKKLKTDFVKVVNDYRARPEVAAAFANFACEASHVDGSYNATARNAELSWLKEETDDGTCRILSNARCLTEGVDVPALDAIMFLHPRKSQIDVVQAVGRVMRLSKDKERGYVILPIGVPAGLTTEEVLADSESYKVVIQVLSALRAHDDEFEATLNKLDLGADVSDHIQLVDATGSPVQIIDPIDRLPKKPNPKPPPDPVPDPNSVPVQRVFQFDEYQRGVYALLVKKLVKKNNWAYWAADIARIAQTHITRITGILANPINQEENAKFGTFLKGLRGDLNDSITDAEAIEMLAQHVITKPVFDTLFEGYSFTQNNPVSVAMQHMLDVLDKHQLADEAESLRRFYASVKMRVSNITDIKAKQRIIVELYDEFFRNAFPKMTERLGIVYTPVEVVDFIIHSINDILKSEFDLTLGSEGVHIIDPFTGTGTFITRLLQSGLIKPEELAHKYQHEIHANEIVLLAYYIAAINIEQVYHSIMQASTDGKASYVPFNGICLADTFALYEKEDLATTVMSDNSGRRKNQKALDIRVIMGNPPYSAGAKRDGDDTKRTSYLTLDQSIRDSYAAHTSAILQGSLYDSYVRAFRWASDRIGASGIVGFVSGSSFIEKPAMDGMRKCLVEDFSNIYIFNLRGDIRKNFISQGAAKEGQNVFRSGSMTGIAISLLVKNPDAKEHGRIFYYDIGDDLKTGEKLNAIAVFKSIKGISSCNGWQPITPDQHNDWIGQRDNSFSAHISLGDKKDTKTITLFENFSLGISTNRSDWCFNLSKSLLIDNMKALSNFYNNEVERYKLEPTVSLNQSSFNLSKFLTINPLKIKWSDTLKDKLKRHLTHEFNEGQITTSLYRPFFKQNLYFDNLFNDRPGRLRSIFPSNSANNRVICINGKGSRNGLTALLATEVPDLNFLEAGAQCFPLYLYDINTEAQSLLSQIEEDDYSLRENSDGELELHEPAEYDENLLNTLSDEAVKRRDGISDVGLQHFKDAYAGDEAAQNINKEDLFYYVYGLLHSPDYKVRYADNLSKELPRIPAVRKFADFQAFSAAGRALADLHVNYETVTPYPVGFAGGAIEMAAFTAADYRVEQMKFAKGVGKSAADKHDKTRVVYNHKITMEGIPLKAYEYVVNGKPALEWVMERQAVIKHKDSGIVNDANLWATETMGDAAYPLKLFQRVITVSLETMAIVKSLPRLDI